MIRTITVSVLAALGIALGTLALEREEAPVSPIPAAHAGDDDWRDKDRRDWDDRDWDDWERRRSSRHGDECWDCDCDNCDCWGKGDDRDCWCEECVCDAC